MIKSGFWLPVWIENANIFKNKKLITKVRKHSVDTCIKKALQSFWWFLSKDIFTLVRIELGQGKKKTKQNKTKTKNKTKQTNKQTNKKQKHLYGDFSKMQFLIKNLAIQIDFFWNSLPKTVHFYILCLVSFQVIWQTQISQKAMKLGGGTILKVFWSSGRPLLCFFRFWPFENVARIRRVYVAYSQTKSVHTRNLASNAKGKCVFVLIAPNDRITSYIAGQVGGQDKIS